MHPGISVKTVLLTALAITLNGCGDQFTRDTTYVRLNYETKSWLTDEAHQERFAMADSSGTVYFDFDHEWGGFLMTSISGDFLGKEVTEYEGIVQYFSSDHDDYFTIRADTKWDVHGDQLKVKLNDTRFTIDMHYKQLVHVGFKEEGKAKYFHDFHWQGDTIYSTITFHDTLSLGNTSYASVFHFEQKDLLEALEPPDITDIYIAKYIGLIGYSDFGGRLMTRVE